MSANPGYESRIEVRVTNSHPMELLSDLIRRFGVLKAGMMVGLGVIHILAFFSGANNLSGVQVGSAVAAFIVLAAVALGGEEEVEDDEEEVREAAFDLADAILDAEDEGITIHEPIAEALDAYREAKQEYLNA